MKLSKIKQERAKTAQSQFYLFTDPSIHAAYRFSVCDSSQKGAVTIGRFKDDFFAKLFLDAVRNDYIHQDTP